MSTRIDDLEIKIVSNSSDAVAAIESLTSSLNALKQSGKIEVTVKNLDKLCESMKKVGSSGSKSAKGLSSLSNALKGVLSTATFKKVGEAIGGWINSANEYIENVNLFTVSMGEYADEAMAYADLLQNKMGIDSSEFMRAQGVFMSMANGFGLAKEQAYQLSKGMTEVSYDLSSFFNLPIEEAFAKVRSGIAGELEPLRALGFALSQATLEELAREKGITKAVASMTEAEKAQLRYTAIVEQAGERGMNAIGDFAATLSSPSNAIRILKQQVVQLGRAFGKVFIPILTQIIPYAQAFVKVLTDLITRFAVFLGFTMPDWGDRDWSTDMDDYSESLDNATASAKKLKSVQMGFDELNVIDPNQGSGSGASGGSSFNLDLEKVWDETKIAGINSQVNELIAKFENLGATVGDTIAVIGSIGVGILAWKGITMLASEGATGFGIIKSAVENVVIAVGKFFGSIVTLNTSALAPALVVIGLVASVVYTLWTNWGLVVATIQGFIASADLEGKFESIKLALEPLVQKIAGLHDLFTLIGTVILTVLQPVFAILAGIITATISVIEPLITVVSGVIDIFAALGMFLVGVFTGDMAKCQEGVDLFTLGVDELFSGMVNFVLELIEGFVEGMNAWFDGLGRAMMQIIGNATAKVVKFFVDMWVNIKNWWSVNVAPKLTVSYWVNKFDGLKEGFKKVVKNMLNSGIDMINRFIGWLNSKLRFSWDGLSIMGKQIYPGGSVQLFTIPQITQRFEDGGFIEDGLFTMNRGEIAGKFNNGKSVVANNEQIIEGISQGVYAAFTRALNENNGNNTYHFYLDGKEIRASIKKNEAETGLSLFGSEIGYGF